MSDLGELMQLENWSNPSHARSSANVCARRDTCGRAGATLHLTQPSICRPVPANPPPPQRLERAFIAQALEEEFELVLWMLPLHQSLERARQLNYLLLCKESV